MRKKFQIIVIIIFIIVFGAACGASNQKSEAEGVTNVEEKLTERQIEILEEAGLPTEYEELTSSQKNSIEAIETLLCYLEDKYGKEYVYVGYVQRSELENEHLIAYPADGSPEDEIIVYRALKDGELYCWDTMNETNALKIYKEVIVDFIASRVDITNAEIYCEGLFEEVEITQENVLRNVAGYVYVYLDEAYCSEDEYLSFLDECKKLLVDNHNGNPNYIWISRSPKEILLEIDEDNYEIMSGKDIFANSNSCEISGDGELGFK